MNILLFSQLKHRKENFILIPKTKWKQKITYGNHCLKTLSKHSTTSLQKDFLEKITSM